METKNNNEFRMSKHDKMFALVKQGNGTIAIVVGQYKVSKRNFDTFEEADKYIAKKPWELILNISAMIYEYKAKQYENKENTPESDKVTEGN